MRINLKSTCEKKPSSKLSPRIKQIDHANSIRAARSGDLSNSLRKKLIAPFQKRQPSKERTQIPERSREFQAQHKEPLYDLIKLSLQKRNFITNIKENEVKQGRFPSEFKAIKCKEDIRKRFLSRKDHLNISKGRTREVARERQGGSHLRERIQKYLYAPVISNTVITNQAPKRIPSYSFAKTGLNKKNLIQFNANANRIPQV